MVKQISGGLIFHDQAVRTTISLQELASECHSFLPQ